MTDSIEAPEGDDHDGLAYEDNISIVWREIDHALDPSHLALVNAANETFLRDLAVIGDSASQKELPEGAGPLGQEIQRLDLKLNLLLDLVGTLIYRQSAIPDSCPARVSADALAWRGDVPSPGKTVFLEVYIQRGLPKPLCCYGEVLSDASECARGEARVRFIGLAGATKSWLEKLIFRHHRREVAYRRATDPSA